MQWQLKILDNAGHYLFYYEVGCSIVIDLLLRRTLQHSVILFGIKYIAIDSNNMKKIICFGELLLRMSPALNRKWIHDANMPVYVGGAELNVATALARWNMPIKYCSAIPDNYLTKEICEELTSDSIDVSSMIFSGDKLGFYYLSQGADLKHSGVIYDRAYSSFSELKPGTINWNEILNGVNWFHFSAISPALNENVAAVCKEVLEFASSKNITISVDLNHRAKLWQYGKHPMAIMPALVEHCDVIMGNIWSANNLLGIDVDEFIHDKKSKAAYLNHATATSNAIMQQFPKCKTVAQTFRFDHENGIKYYAALNDAQQQYVSKEFYTNDVVDKIGSGDCFMAGLIHGLYNKLSPQHTINYAAAAAFGKLHEIGDTTKQTVEDVEKIMNA
jgi:2-dehydro-3-deoxygluconokinase